MAQVRFDRVTARTSGHSVQPWPLLMYHCLIQAVLVFIAQTRFVLLCCSMRISVFACNAHCNKQYFQLAPWCSCGTVLVTSGSPNLSETFQRPTRTMSSWSSRSGLLWLAAIQGELHVSLFRNTGAGFASIINLGRCIAQSTTRGDEVPARRLTVDWRLLFLPCPCLCSLHVYQEGPVYMYE